MLVGILKSIPSKLKHLSIDSADANFLVPAINEILELPSLVLLSFLELDYFDLNGTADGVELLSKLKERGIVVSHVGEKAEMEISI